MSFEQNNEGIILRVRLMPNSSSCSIMGFFINADNQKFLKISVCSVPEKGKANKELINFLSKKIKISKSNFEIISGELDRSKKLLIHGDKENIIAKLELLVNEGKKVD